MTSAVLMLVSVAAQASLPHGNGTFGLGMTRAQVDSALSARGVEIVSDQPSLVSCASDQPGVEYEQYMFFQNGVGAPNVLWRVTLLYEEQATLESFQAAAQGLTMQLGEASGTAIELDPERPAGNVHQLTWVDESVAVQLGARFPDGPVTDADRMKEIWTDRRLQKSLAMRLKRERQRAGGH
jgi:hypothetical protein